MVYIGDLGPLMECAAARLAPRGVLAFSVEATQAGDYILRASGRFAHSRNYIDRVSRGLFEIERAIETQIRLDVRGGAEGTILLLRRTSA
jgi:predicted TPR repeat methyltransferase